MLGKLASLRMIVAAVIATGFTLNIVPRLEAQVISRADFTCPRQAA
jgi:hypothetical protein